MINKMSQGLGGFAGGGGVNGYVHTGAPIDQRQLTGTGLGAMPGQGLSPLQRQFEDDLGQGMGQGLGGMQVQGSLGGMQVQGSLGGMQGMGQGQPLQQYGQYLDNTYDNFDQKRNMFLSNVREQEQNTFGQSQRQQNPFGMDPQQPYNQNDFGGGQIFGNLPPTMDQAARSPNKNFISGLMGSLGAGMVPGFDEGGPVNGGIGSFNNVPRQTEIAGQPHMLAYINPEEESLLQEYRNDAPVLEGPGGVPTYSWWSDNIGDGNSFSESVANVTTRSDGASYVGGQLIDDNTKEPLSAGDTSSTGDVISGAMNNDDNDTNFTESVAGASAETPTTETVATAPAAERVSRWTEGAVYDEASGGFVIPPQETTWWAENVGEGNTFSESVANVTTGSDGASYVGGQLVDDLTGNFIEPGGTTSTGKVIAGTMNNDDNDITPGASTSTDSKKLSATGLYFDEDTGQEVRALPSGQEFLVDSDGVYVSLKTAPVNTTQNNLLQNTANLLNPFDDKTYTNGELVDGDGNKVNSLYENTANLLIPFDDRKYVDGVLVNEAGDTVNTIYQDVANTLTSGDGKEYVAGELLDAEGNPTNTFFENATNNVTGFDNKEYVNGELVITGGGGGGGGGVIVPVEDPIIPVNEDPIIPVNDDPIIPVEDPIIPVEDPIIPVDGGGGGDDDPLASDVLIGSDGTEFSAILSGQPGAPNYLDSGVSGIIDSSYINNGGFRTGVDENYVFDPLKSKYYDANYSPQNVGNQRALTFAELLSQYQNPYAPKTTTGVA